MSNEVFSNEARLKLVAEPPVLTGFAALIENLKLVQDYMRGIQNLGQRRINPYSQFSRTANQITETLRSLTKVGAMPSLNLEHVGFGAVAKQLKLSATGLREHAGQFKAQLHKALREIDTEIEAKQKPTKARLAQLLADKTELANLGRRVTFTGDAKGKSGSTSKDMGMRSAAAMGDFIATGYQVKLKSRPDFQFPSFQQAILAEAGRMDSKTAAVLSRLTTTPNRAMMEAVQASQGPVHAPSLPPTFTVAPGGFTPMSIPAASISAHVAGQIDVAIPAGSATGHVTPGSGPIPMAVPAPALTATLGPGTIQVIIPAEHVRALLGPTGGIPGAKVSSGKGLTAATAGMPVLTPGSVQMELPSKVETGAEPMGVRADLVRNLRRRRDIQAAIDAMAATPKDPAPVALKTKPASTVTPPAAKPPTGTPPPTTTAAAGAGASSLPMDPMDRLTHRKVKWNKEAGRRELVQETYSGPMGRQTVRSYTTDEQGVTTESGATVTMDGSRAKRAIDQAKRKQDRESDQRRRQERIEDAANARANTQLVRAHKTFADAEYREMLAAGKLKGTLSTAGLKAQVAAERAAGKLANKEQAAARLKQLREASEANARGAYGDMLTQGWVPAHTARPTSTRMTSGGRMQTTETRTLMREVDGMRQTSTFSFVRDQFGAVSTSVSQLNHKLKATRGELSAAGRGMPQNIAHVTSWMSSVWLLFGALRAVGLTLKSVIETGHQTARLEQVFSKVGGSTQALRADILSLASANGRSRDEAMESAIQWSRLGLTKVQVANAVRASLMAANVAELDAAEATKHLQAVMAAYSLDVAGLQSTLGELNSISNTWNVTNQDLLTGLSRTAAVARQAGLPLAELVGVIGAAVGFTGQSGANIGNAVKSLSVALSNPEVQNFLNREFQFKVVDSSTNDVKDLSRVLQELFVTYNQLSNAERQYLLVKVAGKTQASRVAAMLDSYVQSQRLAINAQLNLNSAEQENLLITATLKSQLAGVVTEYEKLAAVQFDRGPMQMLTGAASLLRDLLAVANTPLGGSLVTTAMVMSGALAARMAVTYAQNAAAQRNLPPDQVKGYGGKTAQQLAQMGRNLHTNIAAQAAVARTWLGIGGDKVAPTPGSAWGSPLAPGSRTPSGRFMLHRPEDGGAFGTRDGRFVPDAAPVAGYTRAAGLAEAATARLAGAYTNTTKAVRFMGMATVAAGVSFVQLLPYMAVFYLGFKAFDWAVEKVGLSSGTAVGKIDALTQSLEKSKSAAEAAGRAGRLYATLAETWPDIRDPQKKRTALSALTGLDGGLGLSPEESAGIAAADKKGDVDEVRRLLGQGRSRALAAQQVSGVMRDADMAEKVAVQQAELARLRTGPLANTAGGQRRVQDAESELSRLQGERIQAIEEESDALNRSTDETPAMKKHAARQELLTRSVDAFFDSMPGDSRQAAEMKKTAGLDLRMEVRQREIDRLEAERKQLREQANAQGLDRGAAEDRMRNAALALRGPGGKLETANRVAGLLSGAPVPNILAGKSEVAEFRAAAAGLKAASDADANQELLLTGQKIGKLRGAQEEDRAKRRDRGDLEDIAAREDRVGWYKRQAAAQAASLEAGLDPTDALLNRQVGLEGEIVTLRQRAADASGTALDRQAAGIALMQMESELRETVLRVDLRRLELQKEERDLIAEKNREAQRGLLTAGPGEMLKKLAAYQIAGKAAGRGGVGLGEFLALSPEMRGELGLVDPMQYSPEGRSLRRQKGELPGALTPQAFAAVQARERTGLGLGMQAAGEDMVQLQQHHNVLLQQASWAVGQFNHAVVAAAASLGGLVRSLAGGGTAGGPPANPAAAGPATAVGG